MARSIIDIDVNDDSFKRFLRLFEKYQESLGKMGSAWEASAEVQDNMGATFADMSAALMAQQEMLEEQRATKETIAEEQLKALEDQMATEEKLRSKEEGRRRIWRDIAQHAKNTGRWIADATSRASRWIGVGGIVSGLVGAGGLWGLDALADRVAGAYRSATGVGVTPGQQASLGVNFGRYFDTDANLQNIAEARSNYANRWAFSAMGVRPEGKDNATLALEMAMRAREVMSRGDGSQQYAQAHGLMQFYTMEDLRRLMAASPEELQQSATSFQRDTRALGIREDSAKKWREFSTQMSRASSQIERTFVDALTPLIPALTKLSASFATAIQSFMGSRQLRRWLDDAGEGLERFADYLGSERFSNDIRNFMEDMTKLAKWTRRQLVRLGILEDRTPSPGTWRPGATRQESPGVALAENAGIATTGSARDQQQRITQFFHGRGWTPNQAAGITANLWAESAMNPFARGDYNTRTGQHDAYGIAQWHGDRQQAYERLFGHTMQSVTDRVTALSEQLQFVQYELTQGNEQAAGRRLREAATAEQAGAFVSTEYERPRDRHREATRRAAQAQVIVNVFNSTGSRVSVTGAQVAGGR